MGIRCFNHFPAIGIFAVLAFFDKSQLTDIPPFLEVWLKLGG